MNCRICVAVNCDCLCDTCKHARIIDNLPEYVYEMSDYSRKQWIESQLNKEN